MKKVFKLIGRGVKRAFTKDGGTVKTIRDFAGQKDDIYWAAFAVRTLSPVAILAIIYWLSTALGVPVEDLLNTLDQLSE